MKNGKKDKKKIGIMYLPWLNSFIGGQKEILL
jgi:hypothetical protein